MLKNKLAFTIPEILVSLTIIGVVAAIVVPKFVIDIQKHNTTTTLQRVVSQLDTAITNMFNDDNTNNGAVVEKLSDLTDPQFTTENFAKYAGFTKDATQNYTTKTYSGNNYDYKVSTYIIIASTQKQVQLNIKPTYYKDSHTGCGVGIQVLPEINQKIVVEIPTKAFIIIDANGFEKSPNKLGKDTFLFEINQTGTIIPHDQSGTCDGDNITSGVGCTARVVKDGWKIKYY